MSVPLGQAHTETMSKFDSLLLANKEITLNVTTSEPLAGAQDNKITKPFSLVGGLDHTSTPTQLNPIKVSNDGVVAVNSTANDGNDGSGTDRTIKCDGNGILFCKEVGTINVAPANTANGEMSPTQSFNVKNSKVTQGYDTTIASGGAGLQQVLMYGRENGGDLRALECNGDRLIVDCIELSPTGPHTPSSLPGVALYGQVNATNGYRNLNVDTDGSLHVSHVSDKTTTAYTSQAVTGSAFWSVVTDASTFSKVSISINSNAVTNVVVYGCETTGGTYLPVKSLIPMNSPIIGGTGNLAHVELIAPPKFIKLGNPDAGGIVLDVIVTLQNN